MRQLNTYEQQLLSSWEDVFKKGQLTFWVMLALKDGPKHMAAIKLFIAHAANDSLAVDDKSMYRALRRYHDAEMLDCTLQPSPSGPDHKVYSLTVSGRAVLQVFANRNIIDVFYRPDIKKLLEEEIGS